jgi:hypothetical protein
MGWKTWVKLVVGVLLAATSVVFITGCSQERIESAGCVGPQYSQTDIFVPADVCSQQVTSPAMPRPPSKPESAGTAPTPPAGTAASSSVTQLDRRTDLSGITAYTPFGRAIEVLRNSTRPPLNIVVFWNDLRDNAGIDQHTPVGIDIVPGASLRKNLEIILVSLSTRQTKVDYTIIDGVVVIATKDSLPKKMLLRTYDITDLSSRPADYYSGTNDDGAANQGR